MRKFTLSEVLNLLLVIAIIVIVLLQKGELSSTSKSASIAETETLSTNSRNQTLAIIQERKSVRNFVPRKLIPQEEMLTLAKAGMAAPSARNAQPWEIILVTDTNIMNSLCAELPYAKMLTEAGGAVIVCGNIEEALDGDAQSYWIQDCSAVTQNILLAAESMGLGAVWTGVFPIKERENSVNKIMHLPSHIIPLCVIPVGYPTGVDKAKLKFTEKKLHWNLWR